jgi:hypothetical protein
MEWLQLIFLVTICLAIIKIIGIDDLDWFWFL